MSDITRPATPHPQDGLTQNAMNVLAHIDRIQADLAHYRAEAARLARELEFARHDNEALQRNLARVEKDRSYWENYTTQVVTELNMMGDMIDNTLQRFRGQVREPASQAQPQPQQAIAAQPQDQDTGPVDLDAGFAAIVPGAKQEG